VVETRRHSISTWRARAQMWQGLLDLRAGDSPVCSFSNSNLFEHSTIE